MKIAIIGSSGYIGSYLYNELFKKYNIDKYDIKISPKMRGRNVDVSKYGVVIYLAGLTGRVSCSLETWGNIYNENVTDILQLGRKMNKQQILIYASTAGILEGSSDACEECNINTDLLDSYTLSMFEREKAVKGLVTNTVGLRFGTVIGISPVQRKDLVHIAMIKTAYLEGKICVSYPLRKRAILWNKDLVKGINAVLENVDIVKGHEIYNMASFNTTIENIASSIGRIATTPYVISEGGENIEDGFSMDCTKFKKTFDVEFKGNNDRIVNDLKQHIGNICIEKNDESLEKCCRICGSSDGDTIIDLGKQPLANNFVNEPIHQSVYPLCLVRCLECEHTQLNYTVKPEVMFRNYQYNSGTSKTLCSYFQELASLCVKESGLLVGNVLEIACNDGSQLDYFQKLGWDTYGVDPAMNLVIDALGKGHNIKCGFWGVDEFDIPQPDIILAQNVLAHVPDPILFLKACYKVMDEHTTLYIQTSQCNMYRNGEFDTIYHEHLSYFNINSMMKAAEISGLCIVRVEKKKIHGTSYLFTMRKKSDHWLSHSPYVIEQIKEENYTDEFYECYRAKIVNIKKWVIDTIETCKAKKLKLIAYGAAAKGMTMLNYFNIDCIEYIIDDAEMKHWKYTPGTNFQVKPVATIIPEQDICIIVLAWNFIDEITAKIKEIRGGSTSETYIMKVFPNQLYIKL